MFPYIGNVIIPIDELIFFRGVGIPLDHQPVLFFQDAMAPQLLLQRPSDPSGATARALHLPALQPRGAAAHRLRPSAEEGWAKG